MEETNENMKMQKPEIYRNKSNDFKISFLQKN